MDENRLKELNEKVGVFSTGTQSVDTAFNYGIDIPDNATTETSNVVSAFNNSLSNDFNQQTGAYSLSDAITEGQNIVKLKEEAKKTNAWKKYMYSKEEVLQEVRTISTETGIPESALLSSNENLDKGRSVYSYKKKLEKLNQESGKPFDLQKLYEAYPELEKLAKMDDTQAAIALHNLQNVKRVHGIFEAATTGNTIDAITKERSDIGRKLIDGKKLTTADWNRVNELEQALRDQKEIPDLLEAPMEAIVGGTAQQLPMLLRHGIKAQPYGLATGMIGGVISGAATGGVGTGVGFAQGYKTGVKIGYGVEMFKEIAGGYALDYMRYQDKQGNRLFTDNEASTFAIAAALLEAGIELSNYDLVLKTLGGGSAVKRIRDIVSSAQDTASARARLLTMIRDKTVDTGKVAVSESMEEAVQQLATDTVQNVAAIYKPYGNLRVLKDHEITRNAVQAFWQALPASIGLGAGAAGMNSVQVVRDAAHAMAESKQQKEQQRIANEQNVLAQLYEERDNSELSQKSPETFDNLVQENVHGTKYENVYIDTEIANEDKETRIVLNQLAQAAGITEEEVAVINETGAKLTIPTSVFVRSIEDVEVRRKLQNLISFDEAEDCFIRNKRTAKAAIKEMERIAEENVKRQAQAITNIVGETFSDEYERSLAEFIIFQNPDMTPYEAYKKYKSEAKQELEAQLAPIIQQMRDGMGHGITEYWADRETGEEADVGDLIGKQETQEGGSFKHIRVSNNAPWLQKFVKQNGKSPSQKDMKKIAIDILKGYDEYSVYGLDMNNADMDDLAKTKATIEEIQNRLAALERMDAKMKTVDQADIEALESLSPEAVQVYRDLKDKLSQGNKEVKAAARVGALVWAYRCDRFAQYMQKAGYKDYAALDYYKRLQLVAASNAGVGVGNSFNQAAMQKENKRYILNDKGSIDWGYVNNIFADGGTEIKKAPVRMQVGYQVGVDGPGAGYVHIHNRHIDFIKNKGYANIFDIATSVLDNADFICLNNSRDGRPRLEVFVDLSPKTSIMLIMDYTEEKNDAYYTIVSIMPRSKKQLIDKKEKALSFNGSVRPYTTHQQDSVFYTPTDKNAGTNGDSIADKDNAFGTVSLSDADEYVKKYTYDEEVAEQQNTSFEQRAYHGSPMAFNRFDVGFIGSAAGTNTHGWGLYFAKNKKAADGYKKALGKDADASIYEVEVPENKELLDEDKPFAQQLKGIQKRVLEALNGLDDEQKQVFWDNVLLHKLDRSKNTKAANAAYNESRRVYDAIDKLGSNTKLVFVLRGIENTLKNAGYSVEQIEAMKNSEELRQEEMAEYAPAVEDAKAALEAAEAEDARLHDDTIKQAIENPAAIMDSSITGQRIYYGLSNALSNGNKEVSGDRLASEYLNKHGIKGITYNNGPDGRCFVVFDDKAVSIIERYNQSAGTMAITANTQLLEQAKNMEATGAGREEIYKATGWHKGVDGMWRFEIPDNLDKIDFSKLLDSGNVTLGEIYDNPQLYKAYPFLADMLVLSADMPDNVRGSVSYYGRYATSASIQLNKKHFVDSDAKATHKKLASTLIHEIQHLIQGYEGFASGGSQSKVRKQIENTLVMYDDELRSISPEAKQYYAAYDRYNSLKLKAVFGEVTQEELKEADNVLRDSESKVSEAERKHIKRIKALRYQLQKQQDNKVLDDIDAYLNLAGEQEARAATEKAELATRIVNEESEENAEELQKEYDDVVFNGVNEITAIVVFNGGEVARLDADNVVAPVIKGQTDLLSNGERIVRLFATADQSTFLHESAHIFYEDMRELAQDAKAPEELKKDFAKLSDWCRWREDSIKDYEGSAVYKEFIELDKQIKSAKDKPEQAQLLARWEQERFARAFEEYLKQGSAPTKGLAKAFAQLKKWLVKIYRGFISVGAVPSRDVTDIMDRMLVSEEEADRYRKELDLEGFRREGGLKYLNDNVAQMWEQTYIEAVDAAKAKVMKIAMRDITDKNKQERVEKLNKEREQERERLSHDPVFIVWKALQNKDLAGIGMTEMCKNVGITVDEYAKKIKAYGGSLEAAVEDHMWLYERELKEMDIEELKAEARKALDSSYYRKLLNSYEAEFLETAIRKEQRLSRKILRKEQLTEQELKEADVLLAKLDKRKDKEHAYWKSVREEIVRYKKKLKEDYKEQASASVKAYREEADKRAMRNLDEKEDRGRRALRDAVKNHSADIKDYAEKALAKFSIKDGAAVPGIWRKKAKERSQQCNYYISKFDWQKARDAKVMELIYNTMADIAQTNQNKVKRKADALKRRQNTIQREKNLPAKERYLYNHLLYMVGLAKADVPKPQGFDFQEMIASYKGDMEMAFIDADGNITLSDWFIGTAFGDAAPQDFNNLKMAQFKELADFMDNLYTVGVNAKQFKTVTDFDGKKVTIEDAAMAIALGNKAGYNNDPDITKAGSETAIEKAVRWGKRSYLSLVKAETIFRTVGAECMHYCYDPIKQAADNELKETELLVQRLQTIRKDYRESVKQRFLRQIMSESPGIDTKQAEKQADKAADKYMDELTEKKYVLGTSKVSRENILVFALNWGTEKNRLRVVDGFSEDRQKIDAADIENLLKELNGADWTFVSDIWKLFDSYWPRLQDVESRMTGVTMEKEKALEFSILGKDNQVYILDGGYYPIKYDRDKNVQTLQQANDEAARMNMSGSARLGTKLGQTKARSNFNVKGRKIRVDLDVVAEVLSDNIHIITMREAVRDVNRIINHPVFKGMIENSFGKETYTMLQQWVLDCWAREQRSVEWLEVLAQHLRTKQTMAVLGFRTTTALLNILNIAPMADYLGVTRTLKAIKDYYTDKLTNGGKQYEMCMEKSVFLRNRAQTMDRDMRSVIEKQNSVMGGKFDNIQKSAFYFITQTDLMLACPLWISEYKKVYRELVEENAKKRAQLDKQGTENPDIIIKKEDVIEREAVNAGDAAVRRVFGSGQIQDLAAVQKGSEVTKMFTMYYSYFSVVLNALDYKFRETRNKKRTEAMAHIAMGFLFWIILPAVGDTLIKTLISGNDDDKEPEEILKRTGANILNSAAGGIPILRDVVPALTNYALTGKFYGTGGTVFDETMGQTMRILSAIRSDSKDGYDVARESLKLFDNMSGFPQTVTDGIISAMEFIHYGEFTAESIREYLWAIAFDKRPDKKK